jgi:hypothetical protein
MPDAQLGLHGQAHSTSMPIKHINANQATAMMVAATVTVAAMMMVAACRVPGHAQVYVSIHSTATSMVMVLYWQTQMAMLVAMEWRLHANVHPCECPSKKAGICCDNDSHLLRARGSA